MVLRNSQETRENCQPPSVRNSHLDNNLYLCNAGWENFAAFGFCKEAMRTSPFCGSSGILNPEDAVWILSHSLQCLKPTNCPAVMTRMLEKLCLLEMFSPGWRWAFPVLWSQRMWGGGLHKAHGKKLCFQSCLWQHVEFYRHNLGQFKSRNLCILVRSFLGQVFT